MRTRLLNVALGCLAAIVGNFVLNSGAGVALSGGLSGRRPAVHRTRRFAKRRQSRQSSLDVRGLLQKAGLILPEPTETFVSESEDDSLEIEAPIPLLQQGLSQRLNEVIGEIEENWPNKEAVVPEDEEIELETPLQNLDVPLQWLERNFDIRPKQEKLVSEKKALRFETPLSALFPGVLEEAFESTETWTDLLLPLLDAESAARSTTCSKGFHSLKCPFGFPMARAGRADFHIDTDRSVGVEESILRPHEVLVDSMDEANYVTVTLEKPYPF